MISVFFSFKNLVKRKLLKILNIILIIITIVFIMVIKHIPRKDKS